jgi:Ca-activated chloride channel homolog
MDLSQLHFAHPLWFWTLLIIPLVWIVFFLFFREQQPHNQLEKFIDKHLIPYLLLKTEHLKKKTLWTHLFFWSFVWSCLVLALAGPRWDFREISTFTRDQSLAILLDLSESMNAHDISPSRLGRAKQKVEDLLHMSKGVKIGLIAFAADPHMIVPMTEDKETIRHLLPSLDTDLVYVQGSKLAPALEMAATMLENEPGNNKAIVVISDGGFEDASAIHTAKKLSNNGIILYTIGVGSLEGSPLKDRQGAVVKKNGSPVLSKLEKEKFREISKIGHGRYFDADHSKQVSLIFEDLEKRSDIQQETHKTQRFWEERFYLFLLPVIPFFLWWYRRGYLFALLLIMLLPTYTHASLNSYFYNPEQQADQAYAKGDYATAGAAFQDPYRKGVAYYRMGDYTAAEEMFRQSTRSEVACSAAYNLGNALVQQNKLADAIAAYEDVLKKWPDHKQAKDNLELAKKMLEEQEKDSRNHEEKNKQKPQKQEQNKDTSQSQNAEKKEQQQTDSASLEKESNDAQKQENSVSQNTPEKKESLQDEEIAQQSPEQTASLQQEEEKPMPRSQEDLNADLWFNQIKNDPKSFLKKKFYLESKANGTKEEVDPW